MGRLFNGYALDEYLTPTYEQGWYDDLAQQWLIVPPGAAYESNGLFVIGSPGVDGIVWGYRRGEYGIWMYEPISQDFTYLAPSLASFVDGWNVGTITV